MTDTQRLVAPLGPVDAITAPRPSPSSQALAFRLSGVPAVGRWTRLLSRFPLITAWVRPRLCLDEACLVLSWGPWARRVPLSTIVRISLTGRGVALGLSDSTKIELLTFGGLPCRRPRRYAFNEHLCAQIHTCRARALARALRSYRARGG